MLLVEKIRLLFQNARVERLELKPSAERRADDLISLLCGLFRNHLEFLPGVSSCGFCHQLHLARTVHGNEPPCRLVDGLAHREKAVILQDGRLVRTERFRDLLSLVEIDRDPAVIVVKSVIVVEGANVLRDRIELAAERGKGAAISRV